MGIKNFGTGTPRFNEGAVVSGSASGTSSALAVYYNESSKYAAHIQNDQSSAGHVLKLETDPDREY